MRTLILVTLAASASPAFAHAGSSTSLGWTMDPLLTLPLALILLVYLIGRARLAKRGSSSLSGAVQFLSGWCVLTLALVSPLHQAGERSFTMHMIEHELIMLVATFLLASSRSGGVMAWGLPTALRRALRGNWKSPLQKIWKILTEPVAATLVQAAVLWLWHAPALFDRALEGFGWHVAQHASFFVASWLFWWAMLHPRNGRSGYGLSAACLMFTSLIGGALGALMSLSSSPWYLDYAAMGMSGIGLDPIDDQRLAGLIMWIPGGLVHGAAALALFYRWFKFAETSHAALSAR